MKLDQYAHIMAMYSRGDTTFTGAPLSYLRVEIRGGSLYITGVTPLEEDGDRYTAAGTEYQYVLEGEQAEKLLSALSAHGENRPERRIAEEFEFSRPDCLLKDYLDHLHIAYQYYVTPGEKL